MTLGRLILVETSMAGNLGAAIRVAANFGVRRLDLVRCSVPEDSAEVLSWACGGEQRVEIYRHESLDAAALGTRALIAAASARGRDRQPVISPQEMVGELGRRGLETGALVFGNETSGLRREDIDRCDLVVRIPAVNDFPVLNLTQAVAVLLGYLAVESAPGPQSTEQPAQQAAVDGLMSHLRQALLEIGFLDPRNPERVLRKLRRLLGRAAATENEISILRGICRQVQWAARTRCGRWTAGRPEAGAESKPVKSDSIG